MDFRIVVTDIFSALQVRMPVRNKSYTSYNVVISLCLQYVIVLSCNSQTLVSIVKTKTVNCNGAWKSSQLQ